MAAKKSREKRVSKEDRRVPVIAKHLSLSGLADGCPALTSAAGRSLCEAAAVCLSDGHAPPIGLVVRGSVAATYTLDWPTATDQARRTYADPEVATELGACGVAILVMRAQTGFTMEAHLSGYLVAAPGRDRAGSAARAGRA